MTSEQLTPSELNRYLALPEFHKEKFLSIIAEKREQNRNDATVVAGAAAAFEAAKRGDEHPRLNKMMERTERDGARQAAFYASFRPLRPFAVSAPIKSPYYHFTTDHYGTHGSVKAD